MRERHVLRADTSGQLPGIPVIAPIRDYATVKPSRLTLAVALGPVDEEAAAARHLVLPSCS